MQRIAAELGFSETVFLEPRPHGGTSARIFTPGSELPFAGHPLVGAAWLLGSAVGGIWCGIGEVRFRREGELVWIDVAANQPVHPMDLPSWGTPEEACEVLMPLPYHLLRFASPDHVARLEVPPHELGEVLAWSWEEPGRAVKARFFAPGVGVPEDPATGSAAVALGAALRQSGVRSGDLVIHQGDEVGCPSRLLLRWEGSTVSVGGSVVRHETRRLHV